MKTSVPYQHHEEIFSAKRPDPRIASDELLVELVHANRLISHFVRDNALAHVLSAMHKACGQHVVLDARHQAELEKMMVTAKKLWPSVFTPITISGA